jgi:hypothetical protein
VNGVPVCTQEHAQWEPDLTLDGVGGVIIAWDDQRLPDDGIFAQRLSPAGERMWATDGVTVCLADRSEDVTVATDGAGGAIVVWTDERGNDADIFAQRLDPDGNSVWTANGVAVCAWTDDQYESRAISDGAGGVIAAWKDQRSGTHVFAQRLDSQATPLWDPSGGGVGVCPGAPVQSEPELVLAGPGGAIVVWEDGRDASDWDIYAQQIDPAGNRLWGVDGLPVADVPDEQELPFVTTDGSGGAVVAWRDRAGDDDTIYAQRLDSGGNKLWGNDGATVCKASGMRADARVASDEAGGAIVVWRDWRNLGVGEDLYAQRIDKDGDALWTPDGEPLCLAFGSQRDHRLVPDGEGGVLAIWEDARAGFVDIYAQRILGDGGLLSVRDRDDEKDGEANGETITSLALRPTTPNPASQSATLIFALPKAGLARLTVHDARGRLVKQLLDLEMPAGEGEIHWDGRDTRGRRVGAGVYIARLEQEHRVVSTRFTLVR